MSIIRKSWGHEEIIYNGAYCSKKLVYEHPVASSLHYHNYKHECFVVMSGFFSVFVESVGRDWVSMYPGDSVIIPERTKHRIRCLEPGVILESSTHDDPLDCFRLVPSE